MSNPALVSTPPLPAEARPIVIIGAGGIVRDAHLPAYRKAGFPVIGVFDLDQEKAGRLAADFGIPSVFGSVGAAVAGAPPGAVFDIAVPAAAIMDILPQVPDGSGVLIQKPMGEDLATARAIRDLCRARQLKAAINFQLRYAPFVLAARSLLEQGVIGELHGMEVRLAVATPWHLWSAFLEPAVHPEISYHSIHYLDLFRSFLGNPAGVYARTVRHPSAPRLDGTRSAYILDYGDRTWATIVADHHHDYGPEHQESYVQWAGTAGAIRARLGVNLNYPHGVPDRFEFCTRSPDGAPLWQTAEVPGTWFPDAFIGTMASVMRRVEGTADDIPTSVEDAFHTMALVDAASRSSRSGATPILPE